MNAIQEKKQVVPKSRTLTITHDAWLIEALKSYVTRSYAEVAVLEVFWDQDTGATVLRLQSDENLYSIFCAFIDGWKAVKGQQ